MDMGERLQEKWGALPVWAWGAIVAGVALVAYFVLNRNSGHAPSTSTALDPGGYQTSGISGGTATVALDVPESNAGWLTRVSRMVSSALSQSPSEVYAAMQKWLSGQDISVKEKTWIDEAIKLGMAPPEGTQGTSLVVAEPVPFTPPPPAPTPTAPTATVVGYISTSTKAGTYGTTGVNGWFSEISQLLSDGTRRAVTSDTYNSLGKPAHTTVDPSKYFSHKEIGYI